MQAPDQKPPWSPQVFGKQTRISNSSSALPCELHSTAGTFHQLPNGAQTALKRHSPAWGPPRTRPTLCPASHSPLPISGHRALSLRGSARGRTGSVLGWAQGLPWNPPTSLPLVWIAQFIPINASPARLEAQMQENQRKWMRLVLIIIYLFPPGTLCTAVLRNPMSFKFYRNWAFQGPPHRATACGINSKSLCSIPD